MRFAWVRQKQSETDFELIYAPLALLLFLFVRFMPAKFFAAFSCPFLEISGLPCLSCGVTRAFILVSHGEIIQGLKMNPLFAALLLGGLVFSVYALTVISLRLPRLRLISLGRYGHWLLGAVIGGSLLLNWGYLLWIGR